MKWFVQLLRILLLIVLLLATALPAIPGQAARLEQQISPEEKASALLAKMSPEEKVSQLFLVTFQGTDTSVSSRIYSLIHDYHIGGVILRSANDNFTGPDNTPQTAAAMISDMQKIAWDGSQTVVNDPLTHKDLQAQYVPLLVGVSQEGDLYPFDQILSGMTAVPDEMAIGATWKPALAEQVGKVVGSELKSIGFNLFLGPSLDVLDTLHTEVGEDLGTRTFGGDPFWVGEMGKAYIRGLHEGSANGLAVIAKHFPGRGGSDRPPEEEVATVRKSLEQLKQIELAPFFAVTGNAPDAESATDGLLVSHIRYQGFQGNIRATTLPISMDSAALGLVMGLEPLQNWHSTGGLIVSDDLGSAAVRKSYDPTGATFDARQVARSAFLAGNDLLYVDNFVATSDQDTYTTILRTLEMFGQKYREDPAFAERVDQSVERILTMKYRIYPDFNVDQVSPASPDLSALGRSSSISFEVARQSATLISPDQNELTVVLPRPPALRDRIVFLTDVVSAKQCSSCPERSIISVSALEDAVLRLYGPGAGGQILEVLLSSYSFNDLSRYLNDPTESQGIENDLKQADWVVVALLNPSASRPASSAFKRLLTEHADLLRNKRVITFAFNAPYYLDATDISKLTAYYGLYSKTPEFVDVAARLLFQEMPPTGSLPVSVPGIGYDLIVATSPDPNQIIPLYIDVQAEANPLATGTPEPTPVPSFQVGDTIPLRTGVIYDHNRNTVPDGTTVRFVFSTGSDAGTTQQIETVTKNGVAQSSFRISQPGILEIRVVSEPAMTSPILRLDVVAGKPAEATFVVPTQMPTETPRPTLTATPTETPEPTPIPPVPPEPGMGDWMLAMAVVWGSTGGIYWIGRQNGSLRWAVRWGLLAAAGGLAVYFLVMLFWPKEGWLVDAGTPGILALSLIGVLIGWSAGLFWKRYYPYPARNGQSRKSP